MTASASPSQPDFDLVICGGGLAGLALALQVRAALPAARVVVLEKMARPLPEACHKVGESAVELGSHYYSKVLGMADYLEKNHLYKLILKALRAYHAESSVSGMLKQEIKNIEILYDKALYNECNKTLHRAKRILREHLHGWGVVCGLQVVCPPLDGDLERPHETVLVRNGYAIHPSGRDIRLDRPDQLTVLELGALGVAEQALTRGADGRGSAQLGVRVEPVHLAYGIDGDHVGVTRLIERDLQTELVPRAHRAAVVDDPVRGTTDLRIDRQLIERDRCRDGLLAILGACFQQWVRPFGSEGAAGPDGSQQQLVTEEPLDAQIGHGRGVPGVDLHLGSAQAIAPSQ